MPLRFSSQGRFSARSFPLSALHRLNSSGGSMINVALFLLAATVSAVNAQVPQSVEANQVEDVQVRGNRRIPSDTIKFNILTKPGQMLVPEIVARDMKTLYALGYFEDIR